MKQALDIPSNRADFTALDSVKYIWKELNLPIEALQSLSLSGSGCILPSSFKIADLAQSTVALSALAAALIHTLRISSTQSFTPRVTVTRQHAVVAFKSERLYAIEGVPSSGSSWGSIGGLHQAADGYVRIHDSFPHHRAGTLALLGLPASAIRVDVTKQTREWHAQALEDTAAERGLVIYMLRSDSQWKAHPQSAAVPEFPITIRLHPAPTAIDLSPGLAPRLQATYPGSKCLSGLRVLDLTRVIAGPVAGRTLAAHGADVVWVTSPNLPSLPSLDLDLGRGRRTVSLDLNDAGDRQRFRDLVAGADVVMQSYRPGSLAARGFGAEELARENPRVVVANLSAWGENGPWKERRGFDSLVQTASGMNASEAEHFGRKGEVARAMPCQALDHAAGYLLATGILAAMYRQATEELGAYEVHVSLAGVMKYLRSLGQYPGESGFNCLDLSRLEDVQEYLETKPSTFGALTAVKHAASVEGYMPGWDIMPRPLGSDRAEWVTSR
ncbi:MAG: hypothetical protein M1821_000129 [Bathelium mastoideum]|nr:MAG: hypothetical protein M1821_000129 [Bathelium mastoideum]KAI9687839.1 MAG: hypothetical protein M1822_001919 [Bathelium mastoideum]